MNKTSRKHPALVALLAMLPIWLLAFLCSIVMCDCSNTPPSTPRQKAYPRINTHDSSFVALKNSPIHFEISSAAQISLDSIVKNDKDGKGARWINIFYQPYNATLHCTFTPVDTSSIGRVISNREERMALNVGNLTSELIELTNANDFRSHILVTEQSNVTPLQFISTNNQSWVVSGALYINSPRATNIDSIRPIINALKRDLIHSLKTINNP